MDGMQNLGSDAGTKASPADRADTISLDDGIQVEGRISGEKRGGDGATGDAQAVPSSYGAAGGTPDDESAERGDPQAAQEAELE